MASQEYVQQDGSIDIPSGAGVEGLIKSIREILKLPRVQEIRITTPGRVQYTYFLREGEDPREVRFEFDDILPMALVRNSEVQEVSDQEQSVGVVLLQMFRASAIDHLYPTAFVMGSNSAFWRWYEKTTKLKVDTKTQILGLPVFMDRTCPDEVLLLCAAFRKGGDIIDTRKTYKIDIPILDQESA